MQTSSQTKTVYIHTDIEHLNRHRHHRKSCNNFFRDEVRILLVRGCFLDFVHACSVSFCTTDNIQGLWLRGELPGLLTSGPGCCHVRRKFHPSHKCFSSLPWSLPVYVALPRRNDVKLIHLQTLLSITILWNIIPKNYRITNLKHILQYSGTPILSKLMFILTKYFDWFVYQKYNIQYHEVMSSMINVQLMQT